MASDLSLSPSLLAPPWLPDTTSIICYSCGRGFALHRRRHHCRSCGRVFCHGCSTAKRSLPHLGFTKDVRVCDECDTRMRILVTSPLYELMTLEANNALKGIAPILPSRMPDDDLKEIVLAMMAPEEEGGLRCETHFSIEGAHSATFFGCELVDHILSKYDVAGRARVVQLCTQMLVDGYIAHDKGLMLFQDERVLYRFVSGAASDGRHTSNVYSDYEVARLAAHSVGALSALDSDGETDMELRGEDRSIGEGGEVKDEREPVHSMGRHSGGEGDGDQGRDSPFDAIALAGTSDYGESSLLYAEYEPGRKDGGALGAKGEEGIPGSGSNGDGAGGSNSSSSSSGGGGGGRGDGDGAGESQGGKDGGGGVAGRVVHATKEEPLVSPSRSSDPGALSRAENESTVVVEGRPAASE